MKIYDSQVVEIVNNMLQEKFEVPSASINPQARLKEDLKLDSLDFVEMFILLENRTGRTVKDIDFMNIRTLEDIYQLVATLNIEKPVS